MGKIKCVVTETPDGRFHVQDFIGRQKFQHHVYSKVRFKRFLKDADTMNLKVSTMKGECDCGLDLNWVRESDGYVWKDDKNRFP